MKRLLIGILLMSSLLLADDVKDKLEVLKTKVDTVKVELGKVKIYTDDDFKYCMTILELTNKIGLHLDDYDSEYNSTVNDLTDEQKDGILNKLTTLEGSIDNTLTFIKSKQK